MVLRFDMMNWHGVVEYVAKAGLQERKLKKAWDKVLLDDRKKL